jgi:hypothetical protein
MEPAGPVIGVHMDGFTFPFYVVSSILGYELGIKIILFRLLACPRGISFSVVPDERRAHLP